MRRPSLLTALLAAFLYLPTLAHAQEPASAADSASVGADPLTLSLLTCAPGAEVYAAWGHSALRVQDSSTGQDLVFNFGMFDFGAPHFLLKFVRGDLQYFLGIQEAPDFIRLYLEEGREVYEQILDLDPDQETRLFARLLYLYRPENRYYRYGFVDCNCTTALRDLLFDHLPHTYPATAPFDNTWRQQFNAYLAPQPWLRLGVNLILGREVDKPISLRQSLFLPQALYLALQETGLSHGRDLVAREVVHTPSQARSRAAAPFYQAPWFLLGLLALACLPLLRKRAIQNILFWVYGLGGALILFVMAISQHPEVLRNLNILWINPLFLALALLAPERRPRLHSLASLLLLLCLVLAPLVWLLGLQQPDPAFAPLWFLAAAATWCRLQGVQRVLRAQSAQKHNAPGTRPDALA